MTDPWDERYIHLHECLIFMVNVARYASPVDPMGLCILSAFLADFLEPNFKRTFKKLK